MARLCNDMTFADILKLPLLQIRRRPAAFTLVFAAVVAAAIYPSDLDMRQTPEDGGESLQTVQFVENYVRHVNWIFPLALAAASRDVTGLKQIAVITVAGTAATHIPKRLLNDVVIMDTRLGQRPFSAASSHNMPSGHSSLSAAGAYFLARRYSLWFAIVGITVLLLTMYARIALDAHTVSATIAGAGTGVIVAALFSTKKKDFSRQVRNVLGRNKR